MRTTDFILDIERELAEKYPEIKNLGEKTRSTLREIKERLDMFMQ